MQLQAVQTRLSEEEIKIIDKMALHLRQSRSQFIAKAGVDRARALASKLGGNIE